MAISKILMKQSDLYNPEGSIYIADYVNGVFKVVQCTQSEWQKKERCSKGRRERINLVRRVMLANKSLRPRFFFFLRMLPTSAYGQLRYFINLLILVIVNLLYQNALGCK